MLTRKALTNLLTGVFNELVEMGLRPDRMILFGSYAKGNIHAYSDVDLAICNKKFIGEGLIDFELVQPVLRKFRAVNSIDFKMYPTGATAENFDPFIEEIERDGMLWVPEVNALQKVHSVSKSHFST